MDTWTLSGWAVFAVGVALAAWGVHRRPVGARRCPSCAYDLGGTPGLKCPECGRTARSENDLRLSVRRRWPWLLIPLAACTGGLVAFVPRVQSEGWRGAVPTTCLIAAFEPLDSWDTERDWRDPWRKYLASRAGLMTDEWWGWQRQWYIGKAIDRMESDGRPMLQGPETLPADGRVYACVHQPDVIRHADVVVTTPVGTSLLSSNGWNQGSVFDVGPAGAGAQVVPVTIRLQLDGVTVWSGRRLLRYTGAGLLAQRVTPLHNPATSAWIKDQFWVSKQGLYIAEPWEADNQHSHLVCVVLEFLRDGRVVADGYLDFQRGRIPPLSPIREAGLKPTMRWHGHEPFEDVPNDGARWTYRVRGVPAFAAACSPADPPFPLHCWAGEFEAEFRTWAD
jgi:hypothetical protein